MVFFIYPFYSVSDIDYSVVSECVDVVAYCAFCCASVFCVFCWDDKEYQDY